MTRDTTRLSDGTLSVEGGVDSGTAPNLIAGNQLAWLVNGTCRGGFPAPRPGWLRCTLDWQGDESAKSAFRSAMFQVAGGYVTDDGNGSLMSSIGGRQFRIKIAAGQTFKTSEVTIPGDPNSSKLDQAWCCQAENFWLLQNNQEQCFIYNGSSSRRAGPREIPTGKQITYYMGRVVVARGREYVVGDIVHDHSKAVPRASILDFIENIYLNEGGAFAVPSEYGEITAFKPIASINTVLGQGELIVYTDTGAFATLFPQDRTQWKNASDPVQRIIQLSYGAYSQNSVVNVNEDHYYRSPDGIRSLKYSVRNDDEPGNNAISSEVDRALKNDSDAFLRFSSGALFDSRLLMTCSPGHASARGTYHTALAVLDFNLLKRARQKFPPAWEGVWIGLRILQILTVKHSGTDRCFMFVLNKDNEIEVWELTKSDQFDLGETRISWQIEYRSMDFGRKFDRKKLESADLFYDHLSGDVDFTMKYKPDGYPCPVDWKEWTDCAKRQVCFDDEALEGCPTTIPQYRAQYRTNRQLTQPPDDFDPITKKQFRTFFEVQPVLSIVGYCRLKQLRLNAYPVQDIPSGEQL